MARERLGETKLEAKRLRQDPIVMAIEVTTTTTTQRLRITHACGPTARRILIGIYVTLACCLCSAVIVAFCLAFAMPPALL